MTILGAFEKQLEHVLLTLAFGSLKKKILEDGVKKEFPNVSGFLELLSTPLYFPIDIFYKHVFLTNWFKSWMW